MKKIQLITAVALCIFGCTMLESVEIPSTVTRIGDYAFYDCTELAEVTIPGTVTEIGELCFAEGTMTWIVE